MSGTESTLPMDWFTQGDQDIETRYPIGVHTPLQRETLEADLGVVRELIGVIRHKVAM